MATNSNPERFQFRLVTLLLVVTAACLLFGFLEWVLPKDMPIGFRIIIYISFVAFIPYGVWVFYRAQRRMRSPPTEYVSVKVDARWLRRIKSPFIFFPIATLTGVSLTFAPLYLLWCGQMQQFGVLEWIAVPLCFLVIYFVPGFYMSLAAEVIGELVKIDTLPAGTRNTAPTAGSDN